MESKAGNKLLCLLASNVGPVRHIVNIRGASLVVHAIADGRKAAAGILHRLGR